MLCVTNSGLETVIFNPKEIVGILDLRLTDYYKIKNQEYYNKTEVDITASNQLILRVSILIDL